MEKRNPFRFKELRVEHCGLRVENAIVRGADVATTPSSSRAVATEEF